MTLCICQSGTDEGGYKSNPYLITALYFLKSRVVLIFKSNFRGGNAESKAPLSEAQYCSWSIARPH